LKNAMDDSSKYRRTIIALSAAIGSLLILNGCGRDGSREVQGNLLSLRGTVTSEDGKESTRHQQPRPLMIGSKLSVGDRLETSPNSGASLLLIPGICVEIGAT